MSDEAFFLTYFGFGLVSALFIIWRNLVHMREDREDLTVAHVFLGAILLGACTILGALMMLPMALYFVAKVSDLPFWKWKLVRRA